jgi:putative lipoprotein (rSAM/lipoprotein system)
MRKRINIILSTLIALLSGCNPPKKALKGPTVVAIYGVPYATYMVEGTIKNEQNMPIEGATIVVKGYNNQIIGDTIVSDNKGKFELTTSAFPTNKINIVVTDPTNQYEIDSVQHTTTYTKEQEGQGFYRGECKIETEIKLK